MDSYSLKSQFNFQDQNLPNHIKWIENEYQLYDLIDLIRL